LETVTNEKYIDNEVIEAMKWIQEQDSKSDYINNLKVLVKSEFIAHREIGILCSLMACYYKAMNKEQQQKAEKAEVKNEYTGKVGERKDFELIFKKAFGYWSEYGYINIYLFADAEGHEIKWTSQKAIEQEEGEALTIKGTIKAHEEYNGIKQTVLTRCKVMQ
jgi:hypothetical protein